MFPTVQLERNASNFIVGQYCTDGVLLRVSALSHRGTSKERDPPYLTILFRPQESLNDPDLNKYSAIVVSSTESKTRNFQVWMITH